MQTRVFGLLILALSALVLGYVATGLLTEAPILMLFGCLGPIGAAAVGLMMLAKKV